MGAEITEKRGRESKNNLSYFLSQMTEKELQLENAGEI